jgi:hypothetical protein
MLESPQLGSQFAIGLVTATNEPARFQIQEIGDSAGQEGLGGRRAGYASPHITANHDAEKQTEHED